MYVEQADLGSATSSRGLKIPASHEWAVFFAGPASTSFLN
jgi:hypothetical protein